MINEEMGNSYTARSGLTSFEGIPALFWDLTIYHYGIYY